MKSKKNRGGEERKVKLFSSDKWYHQLYRRFRWVRVAVWWPVFSLAILLANCYPVSIVSTPKPSICVTRTERVRTFEGTDVWILEYAVNGELQATMFNSQKAMTKYWEYLHTIGNVYQHEAEDKAR
jgi:hypothetical protein